MHNKTVPDQTVASALAESALLTYSEEVLRTTFQRHAVGLDPVCVGPQFAEDRLAQQRYLTARSLVLDREDERLWKDGKSVPIPGKAFLLLKTLMERSRRLVTKDELFELVWRGLAVSDSVLTTAIKEIRQAIGDKARAPQVIETVHGRGYRFLLEVEPTDELPLKHSPRSPNAPRRLERYWVPALVAIALVFGLRLLLVHMPLERANAVSFTPHPQSIAVLPFEDLSPRHDQGWFAAGMTEEILNSLSSTPDLRVAAQPSGRATHDEDVRAIGRRLNVAYVLEGSLRREGEKVRVTAQLIRSIDGFHVWSEDYDRNTAGVISIQEQIALLIAHSLKTVMSPRKLDAMVHLGTRSVDAYQDYLRGLAYQRRELETGDPAYTLMAYAAFEQARHADPQFAVAHWQAASRYFARATRVGTAAAQSRDEQARIKEYLARVNAAIASSDGRPENLRYRSARALMDFKFREAVQLQRAYLSERPRDLDAWDEMIDLAAYAGDRALMAEGARRIHDYSVENGSPLSRAITGSVLALDTANAVTRAKQQLALRPGEAMIQYQAHRALLWGGRRDEARLILGRIRNSSLPMENKLLAELRQACADGDTRSRALVQEIEAGSNVSTSTRWQALMVFGDKRRAYQLLRPLDRTERLPTLAQYMAYPDFDTRQFPLLQSKLSNDGIRRPPVVDAPYTCRRSTNIKK